MRTPTATAASTVVGDDLLRDPDHGPIYDTRMRTQSAMTFFPKDVFETITGQPTPPDALTLTAYGLGVVLPTTGEGLPAGCIELRPMDWRIYMPPIKRSTAGDDRDRQSPSITPTHEDHDRESSMSGPPSEPSEHHDSDDGNGVLQLEDAVRTLALCRDHGEHGEALLLADTEREPAPAPAPAFPAPEGMPIHMVNQSWRTHMVNQSWRTLAQRCRQQGLPTRIPTGRGGPRRTLTKRELCAQLALGVRYGPAHDFGPAPAPAPAPARRARRQSVDVSPGTTVLDGFIYRPPPNAQCFVPKPLSLLLAEPGHGDGGAARPVRWCRYNKETQRQHSTSRDTMGREKITHATKSTHIATAEKAGVFTCTTITVESQVVRCPRGTRGRSVNLMGPFKFTNDCTLSLGPGYDR